MTDLLEFLCAGKFETRDSFETRPHLSPFLALSLHSSSTLIFRRGLDSTALWLLQLRKRIVRYENHVSDIAQDFLRLTALIAAHER